MRTLFVGLASLLLFDACAAHAQPPTRGPERMGTIVKIVLGTEEEKKQGVLATITIKDKDVEVPVRISTDTRLWISKGKVGDRARPEDFKVGEPVSVWFKTSEDGKVKTEQLMSFRQGTNDLPHR